PPHRRRTPATMGAASAANVLYAFAQSGLPVAAEAAPAGAMGIACGCLGERRSVDRAHRLGVPGDDLQRRRIAVEQREQALRLLRRVAGERVACLPHPVGIGGAPAPAPGPEVGAGNRVAGLRALEQAVEDRRIE